MSATSRSPRTGVPALVRGMPRRALSRFVGALVRAPLPAPVLVPALWTYAWFYGADLAEAARPLDAYATFLDFFTRHLAEGLRPMPGDPRTIVSPADAHVHVAGRVAAGMALQAKGMSYPLEDLLGDPDLAARLEGGSILTLHLAPGDYHRFHWPFDATVTTVRHVPGDLWPVHARSMATVPHVPCRNERVVVHGHLAPSSGAGGAPFAIVALGALNVGSIRLAFHPVRTNRAGRAVPRTWRLEPHAVRRGEELGWFEMGSALVVLLAPEGGTLDPLEPRTPVRVGTPIGVRSHQAPPATSFPDGGPDEHPRPYATP